MLRGTPKTLKHLRMLFGKCKPRPSRQLAQVFLAFAQQRQQSHRFTKKRVKWFRQLLRH
jgi:hypothetical protein